MMIPTSRAAYKEHSNFFAKSVITPEPLSEEKLTSYISYIIEQGPKVPVGWFSIINLYGGPDSEITKKNTKHSA